MSRLCSISLVKAEREYRKYAFKRAPPQSLLSLKAFLENTRLDFLSINVRMTRAKASSFHALTELAEENLKTRKWKEEASARFKSKYDIRQSKDRIEIFGEIKFHST